MTAFKEVLTAEEEAEQKIATAKEEVAAAVVAARNEHQVSLESESLKLDEAERSALVAHQAHIDDSVKKIEAEFAVQITAIEKRFAALKDELEADIKKSFS